MTRSSSAVWKKLGLQYLIINTRTMTEELSVCVSETTRDGEVIGEWQVGTVTREIEQWDRLHHGRTKKEEAEEVRTLPHFKKITKQLDLLFPTSRTMRNTFPLLKLLRLCTPYSCPKWARQKPLWFEYLISTLGYWVKCMVLRWRAISGGPGNSKVGSDGINIGGILFLVLPLSHSLLIY